MENISKEKKPVRKNISSKHYSNQINYINLSNDVESLIGSIPFILLDKTIFKKNMDVVEFANKIGIDIQSGEKKKLDEIVGRIIVAIKEFPPEQVKSLNQAIAQVKTKSLDSPKKDKKSFFEEWDKVIKNM
jgi:ribosomal protein S10